MANHHETCPGKVKRSNTSDWSVFYQRPEQIHLISSYPGETDTVNPRKAYLRARLNLVFLKYPRKEKSTYLRAGLICMYVCM